MSATRTEFLAVWNHSTTLAAIHKTPPKDSEVANSELLTNSRLHACLLIRLGMGTQRRPDSFPAFLVPVIVEHKRSDSPLRVAFHSYPCNAAAVWVEQNRGRFRCQLGDFAVVILLVKKISLAKQRYDDQAPFVDVFSGQSVQLGWRNLERRRVQWDGYAFRKWALLLRLPSVQQQPAGQFKFPVSARPAVVLQSLVDPESNAAACRLESGVEQFVLPRSYHVVFRAVKQPYRRVAHSLRILAGQQ